MSLGILPLLQTIRAQIFGLDFILQYLGQNMHYTRSPAQGDEEGHKGLVWVASGVFVLCRFKSMVSFHFFQLYCLSFTPRLAYISEHNISIAVHVFTIRRWVFPAEWKQICCCRS